MVREKDTAGENGQSNVVSFEDRGRKTQAKKWRWALEAGKAKETDFLLEPLEGGPSYRPALDV